MTCREVVQLVTDYFDGALAPDELERFETHLAECEECAAHLAQMRTTLRVLRAVRVGMPWTVRSPRSSSSRSSTCRSRAPGWSTGTPFWRS